MKRPPDKEKSCVEFDRTLEELNSRLEGVLEYDAARPFRQELRKIRAGLHRLSRLSQKVRTLHDRGDSWPEWERVTAAPAGGERAVLLEMVVAGDNETFRKGVRITFEKGFRISEASSGREVLARVAEAPPAVVIASLILPDMSGLEMYRRLHNLHGQAFLPVLLLGGGAAAEAGRDRKEQGENEFRRSMQEVAARIKLLLEEHRQMAQSLPEPPGLTGHGTLPPDDGTPLPAGNQESAAATAKKDGLLTPMPRSSMFLPLYAEDPLFGKIMDTIGQNLSQPGFTVASLSDILGMSRISLYKKVRAMTGLTPLQLLRTARITRAAHYLRETNTPVSEIAYQVGFSETRYFSRYFRDYYQNLPTAYRKTFRG